MCRGATETLRRITIRASIGRDRTQPAAAVWQIRSLFRADPTFQMQRKVAHEIIVTVFANHRSGAARFAGGS
jgi:hypothetical protein